MFENTFPHTTFRPAPMAAVNILPIAKAFGQIPPGNPGPIPVKDSLHKQPVILGRYANCFLTPRKEVFDPLPLLITQRISSRRHS